jgi:hypothetical protein
MTRPKLVAPVPIAKFWKSPRDRTRHVRLEISEWQDHTLLNIRVWQTGSDGVDRPTKQGIALTVSKIPELARALARAETTAREMGLIDDALHEPAEAQP